MNIISIFENTYNEQKYPAFPPLPQIVFDILNSDFNIIDIEISQGFSFREIVKKTTWREKKKKIITKRLQNVG